MPRRKSTWSPPRRGKPRTRTLSIARERLCESLQEMHEVCAEKDLSFCQELEKLVDRWLAMTRLTERKNYGE